MRSRRDDIDWSAAVGRALTTGVVGMGEATDERDERRLDRFIAIPAGSYVWTRDADRQAYVGRITGSWRRDDSGREVDLVHVRDTSWLPEPVDPTLVPPTVAQTFARGGRNFQQIHPGDVEAETAALWERLNA
jgi:hypothetical protein